MRLIDADKLEELCDIMAEKCSDNAESIWNQFRSTVEWSPTIDAVEVVHCRECINFTQGKDEWGNCFENPMKMWRDTDYCSWGERRTDETN